MNPRISERSFEEAIEAGLLRYGPEARPSGDTPGVKETPYGEGTPGGFQMRQSEDYDRRGIPGTRGHYTYLQRNRYGSRSRSLNGRSRPSSIKSAAAHDFEARKSMHFQMGFRASRDAQMR